jgi:hypothetical protein
MPTSLARSAPLVLLLGLLGCGPPQPQPIIPPPYVPVPGAAPEAQATPEFPSDTPQQIEAPPPGLSAPPPDMRPYTRSSPSLPPSAPTPLPPPANPAIFPSPTPPPGGFAPGLPAGPVTGYGAGGMQQMPGAPPNPPYPPGGLMH